jgi:hypothetical protein
VATARGARGARPPGTRTSGRAHGPAEAARRAGEVGHLRIRLPVLGEVALPAPAHLAWYAGVVVLAAADVVDWPVALVLAAGKALADSRRSAAWREFGEALEEAG